MECIRKLWRWPFRAEGDDDAGLQHLLMLPHDYSVGFCARQDGMARGYITFLVLGAPEFV